MVQAIDYNNPIVILEVCCNCSSHNWNNRHNEAKYNEYAATLAGHLKEKIPNVQVFHNEIPKPFMFSDNYN